MKKKDIVGYRIANARLDQIGLLYWVAGASCSEQAPGNCPGTICLAHTNLAAKVEWRKQFEAGHA